MASKSHRSIVRPRDLCPSALWVYPSPFYCFFRGVRPSVGVKKWFEALTGKFLPFVVSYISHFICSYNLNYNFRPLRGPSIIFILVHPRGPELYQVCCTLLCYRYCLIKKKASWKHNFHPSKRPEVPSSFNSTPVMFMLSCATPDYATCDTPRATRNSNSHDTRYSQLVTPRLAFFPCLIT